MKQLAVVLLLYFLSFINSNAQKSSSIFDWTYDKEIPNEVGLNYGNS